jgi:hypothetical protein
MDIADSLTQHQSTTAIRQDDGHGLAHIWENISLLMILIPVIMCLAWTSGMMMVDLNFNTKLKNLALSRLENFLIDS